MMKKSAIILFVYLFVATGLFAEYEDRVPRTKTITDSTLLNSIRDACHPNSGHTGYDPMIRQYWCDYINITDTIRYFDENGERIETFNTGTYLKEAFWGAIGHDTDQHGDENDTPDEILELAKDFLLDPNNIPYLSIANEVIPYLSQLNAPNPTIWGLTLDMAYTLKNLAVMVDMLWWYDGGIHQSDLTHKLRLNNLTNLEYLFYFTRMEYNKYFE
jgi:hypothetical protein